MIIEKSFVAMKASLTLIFFFSILNPIDGKYSVIINKIEVNSTKQEVFEILYVNVGKTSYNFSGIVKISRLFLRGYIDYLSKITSNFPLLG